MMFVEILINAGRIRRLLAALLDLIIPALASIIILFIYFFEKYPELENQSSIDVQMHIENWQNVWFFLSILGIIFSLFSESIFSSTLGKFITGCRVMSLDGSSASRKSLTFRTATKNAPFLLILIVLLPYRWITLSYPFVEDNFLLFSFVLTIVYVLLDICVLFVLRNRSLHDLPFQTSVFVRSRNRGFEIESALQKNKGSGSQKS